MVDTGFSVPAADLERGRLAMSWWTDPDTGERAVYDPPNGPWSRPPAFPSGGGGLVSTLDDYLRFAGMLLAGGRSDGGRLLARTTVEAMTTNQLAPGRHALVEGEGWGLGLGVVTRRTGIDRSAGSYGWDGGLGTSWWNDPAEGMIGVLLTQRAWDAAGPPKVCLDFWTAAYQAVDDR
jgi:CubicO group peptidase (beta-lactamase class C family)